MTKGVVLFANNNEQVDYIKQAIFCTQQIKKHLDLPVSLVTNSSDHLYKQYSTYVELFDKIISIPKVNSGQRKSFRDGVGPVKKLEWNNLNRSDVYDLTPYDETLVMDTDYIVANNQLLNCFKVNNDFMIWKEATYLNPYGKVWEIKYVSDTSMEMYWATVFYFKKCEKMKTYFNTVQHVRDNWAYYRWIYQIASKNYRNDFAFTIAIWIMNGFEDNKEWPAKLPGTHYYIYDRDQIIDFNDNKFTFLVTVPQDQKKSTATTVKDLNVHVMNKLGLQTVIESKGI